MRSLLFLFCLVLVQPAGAQDACQSAVQKKSKQCGDGLTSAGSSVGGSTSTGLSGAAGNQAGAIAQQKASLGDAQDSCSKLLKSCQQACSSSGGDACQKAFKPMQDQAAAAQSSLSASDLMTMAALGASMAAAQQPQPTPTPAPSPTPVSTPTPESTPEKQVANPGFKKGDGHFSSVDPAVEVGSKSNDFGKSTNDSLSDTPPKTPTQTSNPGVAGGSGGGSSSGGGASVVGQASGGGGDLKKPDAAASSREGDPLGHLDAGGGGGSSSSSSFPGFDFSSKANRLKGIPSRTVASFGAMSFSNKPVGGTYGPSLFVITTNQYHVICRRMNLRTCPR